MAALHKRPTILLVANWDSNVGYAWWLMESYWVAIAEAFHHTHRIVLAYPSITVIPRAIADAPIEVVEIDFNPSSTAGLGEQLQFLRDHDVETMYFSDRPALSLRYLLYRVLGVKNIIVHDHSPGERTTPSPLKRLIKQSLNLLPFVTTDILIGATDYVSRRHVTVNRVPDKKCRTVKNGIPVPPDTPASERALTRAALGIPADRLLVVTTGRAHPYKNIDFALEVISRIAAEPDNPPVHYLLCGDGPHLEALKAQARELGLESNVSFPGKLRNIATILSACDIALHPSKGEVGYSLSILEYMAAGLPVIVPSNPSVSGATVSGETGYIYQEGSADDAARYLTKLIKSKELRDELGEKAERAVKNQFSLEKAHRQLVLSFPGVETGEPSLIRYTQN